MAAPVGRLNLAPDGAQNARDGASEEEQHQDGPDGDEGQDERILSQTLSTSFHLEPRL